MSYVRECHVVVSTLIVQILRRPVRYPSVHGLLSPRPLHTSLPAESSRSEERINQMLAKDPEATKKIRDYVQRCLETHKVVMFGMPGCTYCVKAKNVSGNVEYFEFSSEHGSDL